MLTAELATILGFFGAILAIALVAAPLCRSVAGESNAGVLVWGVFFWLAWSLLSGSTATSSLQLLVRFSVALGAGTVAAVTSRFIYHRHRVAITGFARPLLEKSRESVQHGIRSLGSLELRRLKRFRLSTLLLMMCLVAAWFAYYASPTKRAERAASRLQLSGAEVYFDYQRMGRRSYDPQTAPPAPIIRNIIGSGPFQKADWLILDGRTTGVDEAFKSIAELPSLRLVSLDHCSLNSKHVATLSRLSLLEDLFAVQTGVGDAEVSQLSRLSNLKMLSLGANAISGRCFADFDTPNLTDLFLYENPISDAGLQDICRLSSLEVLALSGDFTDEGASHLDKLKSLRSLTISKSNIGDRTLKALQVLPKLQYVEITASKVTNIGVADFENARPDCKVRVSIQD